MEAAARALPVASAPRLLARRRARVDRGPVVVPTVVVAPAGGRQEGCGARCFLDAGQALWEVRKSDSSAHPGVPAGLGQDCQGWDTRLCARQVGAGYSPMPGPPSETAGLVSSNLTTKAAGCYPALA